MELHEIYHEGIQNADIKFNEEELLYPDKSKQTQSCFENFVFVSSAMVKYIQTLLYHTDIHSFSIDAMDLNELQMQSPDGDAEYIYTDVIIPATVESWFGIPDNAVFALFTELDKNYAYEFIHQVANNDNSHNHYCALDRQAGGIMSLLKHIKTENETTYLFMPTMVMDKLEPQLNIAKCKGMLTEKQKDYKRIDRNAYEKKPSLLPTDVKVPESISVYPSVHNKPRITKQWAVLVSHMNTKDLKLLYSLIHGGCLDDEFWDSHYKIEWKK